MKSKKNTSNSSTNQSLLGRVSKLKERLTELQTRQIKIDTHWTLVDDNIKHSHDFFNFAVETLIKQTSIYEQELKSGTSPRTPDLWNKMISDLHERVAEIRRHFVYLFQMQFTNQLSLYLLMHDFLSTFLPALPLRNILPERRFIILPTGFIQTCSLRYKLLEDYKDYLYPDLIEEVKREKGGTTICFECDPEETINRQTVFGHEIVHHIVRHYNLRRDFQEIIQKDNVKTDKVFPNSSDEDKENYLEELFCDFTSAWHFGPAFAYSFMEEIIFASMYRTKEHPQRVIRILVILDALKGQSHQTIDELKEFHKRYENELHYKITQKDIIFLSNHYKTILNKLKIPLYKYQDNRSMMIKYFENNIPYLYRDIRDFLNNLVKKSELNEVTQKDYNNLILESIRKTTLWREFNKDLVEAGKLFPTAF